MCFFLYQETPTSSPVMLREKLKRSASDACLKPRKREDFRSSLSLSPISNTKKPSSFNSQTPIIVEENLNLEMEQEEANAKAIEKAQAQFEAALDIHKGSSHSDCSELHTDDETYINLHVIHDDVAQVNSSAARCDKTEIFYSSTSDFELVDTNQQFLGL